MRPLLSVLFLFVAITFLAEAGQPRPVYPPPAEVKAAFLKLLERPRVPTDPQVSRSTTDLKENVIEEVLTFASERKADDSVERVPLLILKPAGDTSRRPAVILSHGTGSNKESLRPFLVELTKKGIIGVAIDARYHGARVASTKGNVAYNDAVVRAWRAKPGEKHEHPFFYDTCWDLWRAIDYLQTRDDIDPARIGMYGTSMGGIQTWLASSVDDRVKVIVPAIAIQSFRWSLENDQWQARANTIKAAHEQVAKEMGEAKVNERVCRELWNKVVPGILDQFDCPSMIRLCADRPLLILSGEKDQNCPLGGAKLAFATAEEAYMQAKANSNLRIDVAKDVAHVVTDGQKKMAVEWLAEKLK